MLARPKSQKKNIPLRLNEKEVLEEWGDSTEVKVHVLHVASPGLISSVMWCPEYSWVQPRRPQALVLEQQDLSNDAISD